MTWEVFQYGRAASSVPLVTVTAQHRLRLNDAALAALGNPRRITLLFDPDANVLGLRAADESDRHAHRVGMANHQVSVSGLFKYYGLPDGESRRRQAHLVDGVLCVDLTDEGIDVSRRRRPEIASLVGEQPRPHTTPPERRGRGT